MVRPGAHPSLMPKRPHPSEELVDPEELASHNALVAALQEHMRSTGLTQRQTAIAAKVHESEMSKWFRGGYHIASRTRLLDELVSAYLHGHDEGRTVRVKKASAAASAVLALTAGTKPDSAQTESRGGKGRPSTHPARAQEDAGSDAGYDLKPAVARPARQTCVLLAGCILKPFHKGLCVCPPPTAQRPAAIVASVRNAASAAAVSVPNARAPVSISPAQSSSIAKASAPRSAAYATADGPGLGPGGGSSFGNQGMQCVHRMLAHCRLQQYAEAFDVWGYDDLTFLRSLSNDELKRIATQELGMKPGHAVRFAWSLLQG